MTTPSKQAAPSKAGIAIACMGAAFFLIARAFGAKCARRAQISGEPMPSGRGGAGLLFLFSLIHSSGARMLSNRKAA